MAAEYKNSYSKNIATGLNGSLSYAASLRIKTIEGITTRKYLNGYNDPVTAEFACREYCKAQLANNIFISSITYDIEKYNGEFFDNIIKTGKVEREVNNK